MINKNLRRLYFTFLVLLVFVLYTNAQEQDKYDEEYYTEEGTSQEEFQSRIFFGGNFNLGFGNISSVDISPLIGYTFTERFSIAGGPIYQYYNNKYSRDKYNGFGGRIFGRYLVYKNIFVHVEESLTFADIKGFDNFGIEYTDQAQINDFMIGIGIRQPIGERASANLMILWNLTESGYSVNPSPVIRMGFTF